MEPDIDTRPWEAALAELDDLLAIAPAALGDAFRRDFLRKPDFSNRLSKLVSYIGPTVGAKHYCPVLKPTDFFERILTAIRANNWELVGVEHELPPQVPKTRVSYAMGVAGAAALLSADSGLLLSDLPFELRREMAIEVYRAMNSSAPRRSGLKEDAGDPAQALHAKD